MASRSDPLLADAPSDEPVARSDEPPEPVEQAETPLSLAHILSASAPAILNNVAAPLAAAVQLALLGHSPDSAEATVMGGLATSTP